MHFKLFNKDKIFWKSLSASAAINIFSLITGYTQGFSAILLPELNVSLETASWIASLGVITNPIGALISGFMMDKLGRRTAVQLAFAPFLIGWIMIATSEDVIKLCIGRAVTGLAVGMGSTCYVYVAEVSRPEDRSLLSLFGPTFVSIGVLIIYILGYAIHWRATALFSFICCVIGCLSLQIFPESPVWLNNKGEIKKANEAMMWFRDTEIQPEFREQTDTVHNGDGSHFFKSFLVTKSWKPFIIMIIFFYLQVGTGLYEVVYYAVDFIEKSGSSLKPHVVSISLAVMRSIMSIFGSIAIQNYDRRVMVVLSASGMGITMLLAGIYEFQYENLDIKERPIDMAPQVLMLLNIAFSMLGVHQLPWCLTGELFPLSVRGVMNGIIPSCGYIMIFSMVKMYPLLLDKLSMTGSMFLFSIFSFATVLFGKFILPETRGKSLYEIECMFNKKLKNQSTNQQSTNQFNIEANM